MTLEEAIKILTIARTSSVPHLYPGYLEATQLGIEAGKEVQFYRSIPDGKVHNLLKGETK